MLDPGTMMILYTFIAVSEIALGIYVYSKGRGSPVNRLFLLLATLAGIGTLLDMMTFDLTDAGAAAWAFRLFLFVITIEIGVAYRLNFMVPFESEMPLFRSKPKLYPIAVLGLAVLLSSAVGSVQWEPDGWTPTSPLPLSGLMLVLIAYVLLLTISLRRRRSKLKGEQRRKAVLFSFALALPAVLMLFIMLLSLTGWFTPRVYVVGELMSMVLLGYGIQRYRLLIPSRVTEIGASFEQRVSSLTKGRAYLFEQQSPSRMFASVIKEIQDGTPALIICRVHPDQIRAEYRLTVTPFIWLAQNPGPDRVDPSNLQMLTHLTMEFLSKGQSLIAIEGLEYLLINNEMNKVLKFIGQLRDEVIVEGSILVVTVDPRTLTDRQKAILERELEMVLE